MYFQHPADDQPPVVDSNSADEGEQDGKGKRKKRKKKKKGSGQPAVPNERRVDQPVMLELGSMFERLEVQCTCVCTYQYGSHLWCVYDTVCFIYMYIHVVFYFAGKEI